MKSKRARESFKIENAMCAISNHHFIVFVHTLRLFLVSFWPFDCCVCAHQIKSNNILTNVNSLAFYFIYLFSFLCVYFFSAVMICRLWFLEPQRNWQRQRWRRHLLLAQLFDSLNRSNFKWHIIFDAVHAPRGVNLAIGNHSFIWSFHFLFPVFFSCTHTVKRIASELNYIW